MWPLSFLLTLISLIGVNAEINWNRDAYLDANRTVFIQWKTDDTNLTMKVTTKTTGWLGVGFSSTPSMMGADIVMCWVKDGQRYLQDRHGLADKNERPPIDSHNDYELLEATENGTHTSCTFQRKLNTCDKEDYRIENGTVRVLWSFNPKDPVNATVNGPETHGPRNRGATSINIIGAQYKKPNIKNLKTYNLTVQNVTVPKGKDTLYWCRFFEMPKFDSKHQLVGYAPLIKKGNEMLVHHAVIYECSGDAVEEKFRNLTDENGYNCNSVADKFLLCQRALIVWAIGGKGNFYPDEVGFPFGSKTGSKTYYVLDIHYNNPSSTTAMDNSGFVLYYTNQIRKYEGNLFAVGEKLYLPYLVVPPGLKEHVVVAHCSSECLARALPKTGIKVFAAFPHTHLAGRKMILRHFRDGVELPPVVQNDHYDFDYQEVQMLEKEIVILPNDSLTFECTYSTLNRNETVLGGMATSDEMCEVYLSYYPSVTLSRCFSIMNSSDILKIVGIESVFPTKTDLDPIIIKAPPSLANQSFVDFMKSYKWNQSQVEILQRLEYQSPKIPQCRDAKGVMEGIKPVNYSKAVPYNPPDVCNL